MKKVFSVVLLLMTMTFVACYNPHNSGYPKKVQFNANGGSKTIYGEGHFGAGVYVYEPNDPTAHYDETVDTGTVPRDSFCIHHKWVTVQWTYGERSLTITAEPNTTGQKRAMWIWLDIPLESHAEVDIYQSSN